MSNASYINKVLTWFYDRLKTNFSFVEIEFGGKSYFHTFADNVDVLFTFLTKNYTQIKDSEWCHLVWYRSAIKRNDLSLTNFHWQGKTKQEIQQEGLLKVGYGEGVLGVCEMTVNVLSNSVYMLERIEGWLAVKESSVFVLDGNLGQFWYELQNIQAVTVGQHYFFLPVSCMLYVSLLEEKYDVSVARCIRLTVDGDEPINVGYCQ